uniref:Homeobox domain-containing protein n=1 Tax=Leptobrachium leishanense TaxID=445787 RepID=A0A8C5PLQ7_9ANUR
MIINVIQGPLTRINNRNIVCNLNNISFIVRTRSAHIVFFSLLLSSGRKGSSDSGCEADHPPSANGEEPTKGTRRLRTAFTCEQITVMEKTFKKGKYLAQSSRKKLATKLQLTENQIKTWFQNRRMKQKRETLDSRHNSLYASNLFSLPGYGVQLPAPVYAHAMHNGPQVVAYAPAPPTLNTMPGGFSYSFPPPPNAFNPYQPPILPMMYSPQQSPMYHPAYHDELAYPTLQSQMYPSLYTNDRHFY